MARSKSTEPLRLRAVRRLSAPHDSRSVGDATIERRLAQFLRERGVAFESTPRRKLAAAPIPLPRIIIRRPRNGHSHPLEKSDIVTALRLVGERCFYGLRSVELIQGSSSLLGGNLTLARLTVPGRILIYDLPPSPWVLPGRVARPEHKRLLVGGADVEFISQPQHTVVRWPGDSLREFMLFEVLMHEIGHHLLQHNKGKRTGRVTRTGDHEAFAHLFALRCRRAYGVMQRTST